MEMDTLFSIGLFFILLGILIIIFSIVLGVSKGEENVKAEGAFIGFIGPIPIVIGTSKQAIITALLFFGVMVVLWVLLLRNHGVW